MLSENRVRIFVFAAGIFAAVYLPWWVPLFAVALLALRFQAWEALLIALVVEFLWLPEGAMPQYLIVSILLVWLFEPLRSRFLGQ